MAMTPPASRTRAPDGALLSYRLQGPLTAPHRLVLIHSLALDASIWDCVVARLHDSIQILTWDCRGHGQSDKPKGPYSAEQFADDLAAILDYIGWPTASIAGASMGGCVALAFATRHPQRTLGLGLIDTTACYGEDAPSQWEVRAQKVLLDGLGSLVEFQLSRWFTEAFRAHNPDKVTRLTQIFLRNDLQAYAETCRMLGQADLRRSLGSIAVPTRILVGKDDYATPVSMSENLNRGIAGSTLNVAKCLRHLTPVEDPVLVAAELSALVRDANVRGLA